MLDIVTVGHFALDLIYSSQTVIPKLSLGGPPTYVSLAARKLGARASVISKVGEDFLDEYVAWLSVNGIDLSDLSRVKGSLTTRFLIEYEGEKRRLKLKSRAPPIDLEDILESLQAKAIHVAPIVNEVPLEVINKLRKTTDTLSLDPQGFVRSFSTDGSVGQKRWTNPHVLEQIDIYKSSYDEIRLVTGIKELSVAMKKIHEYGARIVIVTKGSKGSTLLYEECLYKIPAYEVDVFKNPTGAGDVYIGAFLAEHIQGKDPLWCACAGSAASSFVVESACVGLPGSKEEVYDRANKIYKIFR